VDCSQYLDPFIGIALRNKLKVAAYSTPPSRASLHENHLNHTTLIHPQFEKEKRERKKRAIHDRKRTPPFLFTEEEGQEGCYRVGRAVRGRMPSSNPREREILLEGDARGFSEERLGSPASFWGGHTCASYPILLVEWRRS
jgi:hypothetical protein